MTPVYKEHSVDVGGCRTGYIEAGSGSEVVLLVHSVDPGCSAALEYRHNIEPLARHFRVIAPDILGFGRTDMPKPPVAVMSDAYTAHILKFMDVLGIERAHLVGNSRGGLISIAIASAHPNRVHRMILLGNAGGGVPKEEFEKGAAGYRKFRPTRDALKAFLGDSFYSLDRDVPPDVFETYFNNAQKQYERYDKFGPVPLEVPDLRPELARIKVPVLYMFGKEDKRWPPPHVGLDTFLTTPGSRYLMLSECGHHPQTEYPADFNLLGISFLRGELK